VAVGGQTTFQIRFRPGGPGWRTAQVSIASNDSEVPEFQFAVQGVSATTVAANFASPGVPAFITDSANVTGMSFQGSLTHLPATGAELMVIRNDGLDFIEGEFANLPQGGEVGLVHNKRTYRFIADYYGGDGNDLTLVWKHRRLYGWGYNADSLTGDGQIANNKPVPGPATSIEAFAAAHGKFIKHVDAGQNHALVLFMDGSLAAWGHALYGFLGDGVVGSPSTVVTSPVWVDTSGVLQGRRVVSIAAGDSHNLVLCSDGTLAAWGVNTQGQLGDGTKVNKLLPVDAWPLASAGLSGQPAFDVAVGPYHSLLQHRDGTLSYAGYYSGNPGQALTFKPVPAESGLSALAGRKVRQLDAKQANAALCTDGAVVFWIDGALSAPTLVPADAASGSALFGRVVTQIAAGVYGGLALTSDGIITNWGRTGTYQNEVAIPQAVNNGPGSALNGRVPVSISTTYSTYGHSVAVCSDGMLAAWGFNSAGQLGDGTLTTRDTPVLVGPGVLGPGERFTHAWTSGYSTAGFTHAFVASPPPPDLVATGGGLAIPDGDTTPQAADLTDFGPVGIGGGAATATFAIENTGAGILSLTGNPRVAVQGLHPQDFVVVSQPPATVAANGGLAEFQIRFAPKAAGERRATLVIASDEGGGRTQSFDVRGIGATGQLVIEEPAGVECLPGGARDFGTQARGTATVKTFTLRNAGEATLYGISASVGGGDAGNFVISSQPPGELAPGQSAAFTVTLLRCGWAIWPACCASLHPTRPAIPSRSNCLEGAACRISRWPGRAGTPCGAAGAMSISGSQGLDFPVRGKPSRSATTGLPRSRVSWCA
jgi:alpha-tubulin suppressor-like RCC1 family protein